MESPRDGSVTRIERDSHGEMAVSADALWGASTASNAELGGLDAPLARLLDARAQTERGGSGDRGA